jgi:hypothetical protein
MIKQLLNKMSFIGVGRWWLTGILFYIPFQHRIFEIIQQWNNELAISINRLDEITLIIFLPFAIRELYKNRSYNTFYFIILFPVLSLIIIGLISGLLNGNPLFITIHGIFGYVKSFFIIFIYAAIFKEFKDFEKIFHVLVIITVLLGIVGLIQEIWAIYLKYWFEEDIYSHPVYQFSSMVASLLDSPLETAKVNKWRFGLYRASSLLSHYNLLGLFSLFILTFYVTTARKINYFIFFSIFTGIFVSISRIAYTGFLFLMGVQIFKQRRLLITLGVIFFTALSVYFGVLQDFNGIDKLNNMTFQEESTDLKMFRELAMHKSMEVWNDHPLWGKGPGMFGGSTAFRYRSYVYEEYNFNYIFTTIYSLDQFWPQILAEMGIIGAAAFAGLLISLIVTFLILEQRSDSDEVKSLLRGLVIFTVIFFFYTFGGNLNNVSILYPYCAFIGIGLGCSKK